MALALTPAFAEPVTANRIDGLPAGEKSAWKAWLERSQADARADQAAVQAEAVAHKMTNVVRAPSGGNFKLSAKMDNVWYSSRRVKCG